MLAYFKNEIGRRRNDDHFNKSRKNKMFEIKMYNLPLQVKLTHLPTEIMTHIIFE